VTESELCKEFFPVLGGFVCGEPRERHCPISGDGHRAACDLAHHTFQRSHHVNEDSARRLGEMVERS
jgi:hypothetical protein